MTKITSWMCDICKKKFKEGDPGYSANAAVEILIPIGSFAESEERFYFDDTCYDCRVNLSIAINGLIK